MSYPATLVLFLILTLTTSFLGFEVVRARKRGVRGAYAEIPLHCVNQNLVVRETRVLGTIMGCTMYVVKPARLIATESTVMSGTNSIVFVDADDPRIASSTSTNDQDAPPGVVVPSGKA